MKKKFEKDFLLAGLPVKAVLILIWGYSGLNVLLWFYFYSVSMGILWLYFYNKDAKEEREKKAELPGPCHFRPSTLTLKKS